MNKKFLSAVLFGALMVGSTVTFTGCIDNDEPAGIETLRGAKAELLKAKAAVETANAAYRNAQAQHELAMVENQNLLNEWQKLDNQLKELEVQEKTARVEAAIAEIKATLEVKKLQWEQNLLTEQKNLAYAQKAYEDAMKALELSKEYLSDAELTQLNHVKAKLDAAKGAMETAQGALTTAFGTYKTAVTKPENYLNEATLKEAISVAETNLAKATNKLNLKLEALEALESDDKYAAWQEVRKDFQNKKDSVDRVIADKNDQISKLVAYENNHSIDGLKKAITKVQGITTGKVAKENPDPFEVSTAIKSYITLTTDANAAILAYNSTDGTLTIGNFDQAIIGGYKDKDGEGATTDYTTMLKYNFVFNGASGYDATSKAIAGAITDVTKAKEGVDPNGPAWAEDNLAAAKTAMEDAKKTSDDAISAWKKAVASLGTKYDQQAFNEDEAVLEAQVKTAKEAASDTDPLVTSALAKYKVTYNKMLSYDQTIVTADKNAIDAAIASATAFRTAATTGGILTGKFTFKSVDPEQVLEVAAEAAFGVAYKDADGKVYRVMPTDEYVLANDDPATGAYTLYLKSVEAYNEAKEATELDDQFDAVLTQLNAWAKTLSDAKTAYEEKNKETLDAVTAAQNTVKEKVVTPIAALKLSADTDYKKDIDDMLTAITNNDDVKEFERLISALKTEIGDKNGVDGKTASTGLYKKVEDAEIALLKAEKNLELFNAGNLNEQYVITWAQEALDRAKAEYEDSVVEFNYWNGKLEDMMKALYSKSSAE